MDIIEFLERTDQRNLHYNVGYLVKQSLRQREEELQRRRLRCGHIYDSERLQYEEELVLLLQERVLENAHRRQEFIGIARIEREQAEEELLKLKNMQRELENCEEWRMLQSKEILLETKKAQLYQIEEKKLLRMRERAIEQMWQEAMCRLYAEKAHQEAYEQKLRKLIAGQNQESNTRQEEETKLRIKTELKDLQQELAEDNVRAVQFENIYRHNEKVHELHKKMQQNIMLTDQMRQNQHNLEAQHLQDLQEDHQLLEQEQKEITQAFSQHLYAKLNNREWHKAYLKHVLNEKQVMHEKDKEFDDKLIGSGCVLQQRNKKPYGKDVR